jgi:hypothetical protein
MFSVFGDRSASSLLKFDDNARRANEKKYEADYNERCWMLGLIQHPASSIQYLLKEKI